MMKNYCIFCGKETEWKFCQFGYQTNYFQCHECHAVTPPKQTKDKAIAELKKMME